MSIILVSSGVCLKGSRMGQLIDQFDEVVRFHNYGGGEPKDLGTKTTMWAYYDETSNLVTPSGVNDHLKLTYGGDLWYNDRCVQKKAHKKIREVIPYPEDKWPTTGIVCLSWLVTQHPLVYLIGWYQNVNTFKYHYNEEAKENALKTHSLVHDVMYLQHLESEGKIARLRV